MRTSVAVAAAPSHRPGGWSAWHLRGSWVTMSPMLLGRDAELELVRGLVDAARAGTSGVLVLRGEAGIGKTVLLDEAERMAEGEFALLRVDGYESEAELPFAALHQLLRPLLGGLAALPERQAAALGAAFGIAPEGAA